VKEFALPAPSSPVARPNSATKIEQAKHRRKNQQPGTRLTPLESKGKSLTLQPSVAIQLRAGSRWVLPGRTGRNSDLDDIPKAGRARHCTTLHKPLHNDPGWAEFSGVQPGRIRSNFRESYWKESPSLLSHQIVYL